MHVPAGYLICVQIGCVLAIGGFALYSHTKIVKFREGIQPRVISLAATGSSASELAPLKGDIAGVLHRVVSNASSTDKV
jgi:hypothetical protein